MGPKKPAARPVKQKVNYDNGRDLMDRDLKNWYLQHKDYYHDFKSSLEDAFLNDNKETIREIFGGLSSLITKEMPILKAGKKMFSKDPVKLGEFEKNNTEAVDWVSNDLDATIASTFHPFQADKLDALKDSFEKGELFLASGNRLLKQYPNMSAIAGTRPLYRIRYTPVLAYTDESKHIFLIAVFAVLIIKISTQEVTCIIRQYGVDAYCKRLPPFIHTTQVLINLCVTQSNKLAVRTVGAFVFFSITKRSPTVGACRHVTGLATIAAGPSECKHILPTFEQTSKEILPLLQDLLFAQQALIISVGAYSKDLLVFRRRILFVANAMC